MPVTCQTIIDAMERIAPQNLAADWDNVGLLIGSRSQMVDNIIISLDVTQEIVEQAASWGKSLIISHHPLIFKKISTIRTDLPLGSLLAQIIKNDLAVYAAHTNLDIAPGGINDILAQKIGLLNTRPLEKTFTEKLYKIIVFVPEENLNEVRAVMSQAGAGHIGNYSHCTFESPGTGTFLPLEQSKPYIGEQGRLEFVKERRLETIVPEKLKGKVVSAMLKAHPYEEVAYDEILLQNQGQSYGLGRVGKLEQPILITEFIEKVKAVLGQSRVKVAGNAASEKFVSSVAVCGGSGGSLVQNAVKAGVDVFITGDVKYHEAQDAVNAGLVVIDAGHFSTENLFVPEIVGYLGKCAQENNWSVKISGNTDIEDVFSVY